MNDIIKIGISGNALGSGGYSNLINVGFDDVVVNRQVSFKGQTDTEYSIEVQQDANEAVFVLVANPLTVYSAGASRGGALCIFLSIPAGTYFREEFTPLTLLIHILNLFRKENMIQKVNVWEYQFKAYYDRTPFLTLSEDVKQYLADLPTYVQMEGDSELLVSIGDKLDAFFKGDFQYPKFKECSRLVIADHIDGSTWKPTEIPRPWFLKVKYNGNEVVKLLNSNTESDPITIILDPADKECYEPTEIKICFDGYEVKTAPECYVDPDWQRGNVSIVPKVWPAKPLFVPIFFEGIESLSPDEIVCTFSGKPKVEIQAMKNPDEVLGFEFRGTQIRAVKGDMFHINNDSYNFTVTLVYEDGVPEGIHIEAKSKPDPKSEQKSETVQMQTSSSELSEPNPTLKTVSNPSQFRLAQDSADNNPKKKKGNEPVTEGHGEDDVVKTAYTLTNATGEALVVSKLEFFIKDCEKPKTFSEKFTLEDGNSKEYDLEECTYRKLQRVIIYFKKYVKLEKEIVDIKNREIKIAPSDLRLKFYRQPGFWPGVGVGTIGMFLLGLLVFCAVWLYSLFPDSDATALLKCKIPQVKQQSLFIYDSLELTTAIHYYISCSDENDEIKRKKDSLLPVIRNQVEHITNLLYKLDYEDYQLTFDDPKTIQKWINESGICDLKAQITDIDTLMRYCPMFVKTGEHIKTLLKDLPELTKDRDYKVASGDYGALKEVNDELKDDHFKPIRMCIQGFYGLDNAPTNKYTAKFKIILDTKREVRNYNSFAQITHNFEESTK